MDTSDDSSSSDESDGEGSDDGEDKWSPALDRKKAGFRKRDLRLEGSVKRWKAKKYVLAEGPKNSTRYSLLNSKDVPEFDDHTAPNLHDSRYGELRAGKDYKYNKAHAKSIQGVAWHVDRQVMDTYKKDFPEEVDLLKPKKSLPVIGETSKGVIRMAVVDCVIKIKWLIGGEFVSSWETRGTVRRIWGHDKGDLAIYEAAKNQEDKFWLWKTGKREGRSQSQTPFIVRELTEERDARGKTPTPDRKVQFQGSQQGTSKLSLKDWKEKYYDDKFLDPQELTPEEIREMKNAWKAYNRA
jgi:hypothetical protein